MKQYAARLLPVTAVLAVTAACAAAIVMMTAAPAPATYSPYTPQLAATSGTAVKFTVQTATANTVSSPASKRQATVAAARRKSAIAAGAVTVSAPAGSELAQAQSILAGLIAAHPILKGTTVEIGNAQGYQAVAYYRSGRIVISPTHTASLSRILNHEVWHVIDWRDNGRIDWGENIPPR